MNHEQLTHKTAALARQVGEFLRQELVKFDRSDIETKSSGIDLVSYVDRECERRLVEGLKELLPTAGFLGEEGTDIPGDHRWVIDPLDGTTNFLHGLAPHAVSIALEAPSGERIIGVVHEAVANETFYAWKGGGAYLDGKRIQVSGMQRLGDSLIATGFPYEVEDRLPEYFEILTTFLKGTHGLRRLGSAACDLCYVACGRMDAYFEFNLKPWDVAGGEVVAREAGGTVTNFDGQDVPIDGGSLLVATPGIHAACLEVIHSFWKR